MIGVDALVKRFPGAERPAVDRLTLAIREGEVCVLIGPSGCGKTTTMRLLNRMIEPDSGTVTLAGRDIATTDPVALRRHVGYVIQQVGLFPHWTIADNVATVPRLLRWEETKIAARVDELLSLVGMDPATYRERFPRELSGGQKQRVGVARALAADPPVMLMDEPFGALDPITRARLQDEFLRILHRLAKTVVLVTHDIDEAIRMGDRIAIMREGALVQYDTPQAILTSPADDFVEAFVGADRALKRLALAAAGDVAAPEGTATAAPPIAATANLRDALAQMLALGVDALRIDGPPGSPPRVLTLAAIRASVRTETAGGHRTLDGD